MKNSDISMAVIKRLPRYYRFLGDLKRSGMVRISSRELSSRMGLTASQIRQDLSCFGGFGQQGYGYNVGQLQMEIGRILGLETPLKVIILGAGNLGRTLASYITNEAVGFQCIGIFDVKESVAGQLIGGIPVQLIGGLDDFCREHHPDVAVLCTPSEAAATLSDQLVQLKIRSFWNFTHVAIGLRHPQIPVENVHLGDSLMTLCYRTHHDPNYEE